MISVIIPTLNEAPAVRAMAQSLYSIRRSEVEIIIVDGGSSDGTLEVATLLANRVEIAPRGRASQMNRGASLSRGNILLFLHADTALPESAISLIEEALSKPAHVWGRFDIQIEPPLPLLRLVALFMNLRSRLTGIATGDQAIFVRRSAFVDAGGFPDIPLMEDIALTRALKHLCPPVCLRARVTTSGRRWERNGVLRTIALMWWLRMSFFFGADPARLAERYDYARRS